MRLRKPVPMSFPSAVPAIVAAPDAAWTRLAPITNVM